MIKNKISKLISDSTDCIIAFFIVKNWISFVKIWLYYFIFIKVITFALFGSFCGGKKNNKKIWLKYNYFSIYLNNYILSKKFKVFLFVVALPPHPHFFYTNKRSKTTAFLSKIYALSYILYYYEHVNLRNQKVQI